MGVTVTGYISIDRCHQPHSTFIQRSMLTQLVYHSSRPGLHHEHGPVKGLQHEHGPVKGLHHEHGPVKGLHHEHGASQRVVS